MHHGRSVIYLGYCRNFLSIGKIKSVKSIVVVHSKLFSGNCLKKSQVITPKFNIRWQTHQAPTPQVASDKKKTNYSIRSHTCGELRNGDIGTKVKLCGWIQFSRFKSFIIIRDAYGVTQLITANERDDVKFAWVFALPMESVVQVTGEVIARPPGQENKRMPTGEIEVRIDDVELISKARPQLPFEVKDFYKVRESLNLQYRYLAMRKSSMQFILRFRSHFIRRIREFLYQQGFADVETPCLFKRTPGGAREFVVPTSRSSMFYSLVQSPQQFKQLLMIGGMDKYFQIAKCFRDETSKQDRQPEFTQLDLEMSFTTSEHVRQVTEDVLQHAWPQDLIGSPLTTPLPSMTYQQALDTYGTDKPDTRFELLIRDITDIISETNDSDVRMAIERTNARAKCIILEKNKVVTSWKKLLQLVDKYIDKDLFEENTLVMLAFSCGTNSKLSQLTASHLPLDTQSRLINLIDMKPDTVALTLVGPNELVDKNLGQIRLQMANLLEAQGIPVREKDAFNLLWVTDFPLFLPTADGGVESAHHPFTAPHPHTAHLIHTEPLHVIGQHYDLVLNGVEIGGGSMRIHDAQLQRYILKDILKEDCNDLEHLLFALECGCPPHGGIALGLDRLIACLCQCASIRDVMAFPKSSEGKDLMSNAPCAVPLEELARYHISIITEGETGENVMV